MTKDVLCILFHFTKDMDFYIEFNNISRKCLDIKKMALIFIYFIYFIYFNYILNNAFYINSIILIENDLINSIIILMKQIKFYSNNSMTYSLIVLMN